MIKCVKIVFSVCFIRDEIHITVFINRCAKIFSDPVCISLILFGFGIIRFNVGIERALVMFALHLVAALPGIVKKYFTAGRMFYQVMIIQKKIIAEYPLWCATIFTYFKS